VRLLLPRAELLLTRYVPGPSAAFTFISFTFEHYISHGPRVFPRAIAPELQETHLKIVQIRRSHVPKVQSCSAAPGGKTCQQCCRCVDFPREIRYQGTNSILNGWTGDRRMRRIELGVVVPLFVVVVLLPFSFQGYRW
jgi:hypothetical protein